MTLEWRLVKFIALLLVGAGWIGAFAPPDLATRQRAVYLLATPGLLLSWLAGFGLARQLDVSLGERWISASMLIALASYQVVVWAVEREGRRSPLLAALALGGLVAVVALMVVRP